MRHACIAVNVQIHSEAAGSLRIIVHTTKGTADTVPFVVLLFFSMLPVGQIRRPCYKIRSFTRPPQDLFGGVQENRQRSRGQYRFFRFGIRNMAATMAAISSAVTTENRIPLISQIRKNQGNSCPEPASTQEGHQGGDKLFLRAAKKRAHK